MRTSQPVDDIEQALIRIRRASARQALRSAGAPDAPPAAGALFSVLDALESTDLSVTELARAIGVDQPRASRLVAQAIDAGYVHRSPHPADGRRSVVSLAPGGRALVDSAHRTRRAAVRAALAGFSDRESATLARLLDRFLAAWPAR